MTYTLVVSNQGPSVATGINLTDILPATVRTASAKATQGVCAGSSTITRSLGSLSPGAASTVTIVVTADSAGTITNQASVSSAVADPNAANNTSSSSTVVTAK